MGNVWGLLIWSSMIIQIRAFNQGNTPDKSIMKFQLLYFTRQCTFLRHIEACNDRSNSYEQCCFRKLSTRARSNGRQRPLYKRISSNSQSIYLLPKPQTRFSTSRQRVPSSPKNRAGLKAWGSTKISGSWKMSLGICHSWSLRNITIPQTHHRLTQIIEPLGISIPL